MNCVLQWQMGRCPAFCPHSELDAEDASRVTQQQIKRSAPPEAQLQVCLRVCLGVCVCVCVCVLMTCSSVSGRVLT